jgi:hypothetical protein
LQKPIKLHGNTHKMNKYYLTILLVLSGMLGALAQSEVDTYIMTTAESQLSVFLAKIPQGEEVTFGFSKHDDLDNCKVGKPYRIMEFSRDFYGSELSENIDYIVVKNEWRVPVTSKGQHRILLNVNGNPGNYAVTGMGEPEMARELQRKSAGGSEKDAWYILRLYPLMAEFFVREGNNSFFEAQFMPLASAVSSIPALAKAAKTTYTLTEVEHMVKDATAPKTRDDVPPAKPRKAAVKRPVSEKIK